MKDLTIEDNRDSTSWVPAPEILREVLPHLQRRNFVGIRKIVLLDEDYHRGEKALGRHCPIEGTNQADIEMYFDWYESLPEEVKASRLYLTSIITRVLMHEVYHHIIRCQHRLRRPKFKKEQSDAERWAEGAVHHVFETLYPKDQYEDEWLRLRAIVEKARAAASTSDAG